MTKNSAYGLVLLTRQTEKLTCAFITKNHEILLAGCTTGSLQPHHPTTNKLSRVACHQAPPRLYRVPVVPCAISRSLTRCLRVFLLLPSLFVCVTTRCGGNRLGNKQTNERTREEQTFQCRQRSSLCGPRLQHKIRIARPSIANRQGRTQKGGHLTSKAEALD